MPYGFNDNKSKYELSDLLNMFYPIGTIYETRKKPTQFDPNTEWGGTWVRITDKFLLASGSNYAPGAADGGAATVTLNAAQSGLREHTHSFTQPTINGSGTLTTNSGGANAIDNDNTLLNLLANHYHNPTNGSGYGFLTYQEGGGVERQRVATSSSGRFTHVGLEGATSAANSQLNFAGSTAAAVIGTAGFRSTAHTHSINSHTHTATGGAVSKAAALNATAEHENMPPYTVITVWERTA